jgi:hypothetical protein
MVKEESRTVEMVTFPVHVLQPDIDGGECLLTNKCMVRVATIRSIGKHFSPQKGSANIKVRCDAGHIWATFSGYRWIGDMPRVAKTALIQFDAEVREKNKAKRTGKPFKSKVEPFTFTCKLRRLGKVVTQKWSEARRQQIYAARREREAVTGVKDHRRYRTLRKRIVGFA